jgi:hypothetical protein
VPPAERNWVEWHDSYSNPGSQLSQRLAVVQRHVRAFLDSSTAPQIISLCAGDGRDLLDVLAERRTPVRARLVELDPGLAGAARARVAAAQLEPFVDVVCADAALTDMYAGACPADLVLVCGVLGNISDADVRRTIRALPQLCARAATVVWTRHRRDPDLTPAIRRWFGEAGFDEVAFDSPGADGWSVGVNVLAGEPRPFTPGLRLFTFRGG